MAKYFALEAAGKRYLDPEDIIKIIIQNFTNYEFDEETARKEAEERLKFLKDMNADQILIDMYKDAKPVRCLIYNSDKSKHFHFDVSNNQGIMVFPSYDLLEEDGLIDLVQQLAEKIGYQIEIEQGG